MPIYEYVCNECGHEFEEMQKISDKPIRKCEKCGRLKAKRQVSRTSFVLKGNGWYATDFADKKSNAGSGTKVVDTSGDTSSKSTSSSKKPAKSGPKAKAAGA